MTMEASLSVSIVFYRSDLAVLARTLDSLARSILYVRNFRRLSACIHVIDNSCDKIWSPRLVQVIRESTPNSTGIDMKLLVLPRNYGYGAGNNQVLDALESDFHLVLNPDVLLDEDAIAVALAQLGAHREMGLIVPDVRGEDGMRHHLCKRDPTLWIMLLRNFMPGILRRPFRHMLNRFEMRERDYERAMDIEFPTGCCMFLRTSVFKDVGGFDPRFFLYFEDADLGRRVRAVSRVSYVPEIHVTHLWTRGNRNSWRLQLICIWSGLKYCWKWNIVRRLRPATVEPKNEQSYAG